MNKRIPVLIALSVLAIGAVAVSNSGAEDPKTQKFVVILQAGSESHEGLARALHALLYAAELKEAGYDVVLLFDGAGTAWAREFEQPEHKLHGAYANLKKLGVTQEICDYCSSAFQVKDRLSEEQRGFLNHSYNGHPSLVKWIARGYSIIVL
ncbi:MAG: DsrE family protein [Candidatus Hydrogenedentes bacterium]|nr:DsrE family protein [Candidatus Hydrogenedentota bacterium]